MKKYINLITLSILSTILLIACSKNQKVVRQLEGDWIVTSYIINGVSQNMSEIGDIKYTFEKCRVKKEDCNGVMSAFDEDKGGDIGINFDYNIQDKGDKINIKFNLMGIIDTRVGKIIEQSKSKFEYEYNESTTESVYNPDTGMYEDVTSNYVVVETLEKK